ncbi:hypothetical protein FB45DRAFT_753490 [Roridomyces roridus]|uniref:Ubiquitin 3 binding protein But2 C-terminal domain-containing protein n=1 Tax=Roridomyces roridus TaxID=1738132 RepID=A0AAD7BJK1_9AGAR|nr:hypothetical protein FB45DRAFT_753490 [Roridomyces roridus]
MVLALVVCLLCTGVNIVLSTQHLITPPRITPFSLTRADIPRLRRPSQFIRFDEIKRPLPVQPKQLTNYPIVVAQIDEANKGRVFEVDTKRYLSPIGTISPEDRRVLLTNEISTVVQFRAVDYGLEICELHIQFAEDVAPPSDSFTLSLFRLNTSLPVEARKLSYNTRPQRVGTKLAEIAVKPKTPLHWHHWHRKFSCVMEELLTFELGCSPLGDKKACEMEWWQNKDHPVSGMWKVFTPLRCSDGNSSHVSHSACYGVRMVEHSIAGNFSVLGFHFVWVDRSLNNN